MFLSWMYANQRSFIYQPSKADLTSCAQALNATAINENGMQGIFWKGGDKIAVVYHGNGGSACDRTLYSTLLRDKGYSVFSVEYPGYTNSDQQPSIQAILAIVPKVAAFISAQHPTKVVIIGESLGSGVAAYHARLYPYDRLILVTPYDSMTELVQEKVPFLPAKLILTETYDEAAWAAHVPDAHIIYAINDTYIPPRHAQMLYTSIETRNKTIVGIPDANHVTIYSSPLFASELLKTIQ
jgi:esterase/lipase